MQNNHINTAVIMDKMTQLSFQCWLAGPEIPLRGQTECWLPLTTTGECIYIPGDFYSIQILFIYNLLLKLRKVSFQICSKYHFNMILLQQVIDIITEKVIWEINLSIHGVNCFKFLTTKHENRMFPENV